MDEAQHTFPVDQRDISPGVLMAIAPWRPLWAAWAYQSEALGRAYAAQMRLMFEAQSSMLHAGLSLYDPRHVQDVAASARLAEVSREAATSQDAVLRAQLAVVDELRRPAA